MAAISFSYGFFFCLYRELASPENAMTGRSDTLSQKRSFWCSPVSRFTTLCAKVCGDADQIRNSDHWAMEAELEYGRSGQMPNVGKSTL
jgi:hypothetical protein